MNEEIIKYMNRYFAAGLSLNLEEMDKLYDPEFENIRMDTKGNIVTITKAQFMNRFRQMKAAHIDLPPTDDVQFLGTTDYEPYCSILIRRVKEGIPLLYNFVWKINEGAYTLIREFTVEQDITYLLRMIAETKQD